MLLGAAEKRYASAGQLQLPCLFRVQIVKVVIT